MQECVCDLVQTVSNVTALALAFMETTALFVSTTFFLQTEQVDLEYTANPLS